MSEIYIATCIHPDAGLKRYVGQTRTHVLNHGKYRPFGMHKRWAQHLSEAKVNDTVRQSWKLNNAIRKYGQETFVLELLHVCTLDWADAYEQMFISLFNTVTNGYNIQYGGGSGAKNAEESCAKIATTLEEMNDKMRMAKYADWKVKQVRVVRLEDKGVRVYITSEDGRESYTSFFGRRSTFENASERAIAFINRLTDGDKTKIYVTASLADRIKF